MRSAWLLLTGAVLLVSCKPESPGAGAPAEAEPAVLTGSQELVADFPLLPLIEKSLWRQLKEAEAGRAAASPTEREAAIKDVERLTEKLRKRHPFRATDARMELGGIVYDKSQKRFTVPARVRYPDAGDARHPGELELLLCTEAGRSHETLFVSDARPLHLELLMHLAGYTKGTRFRMDALTADGVRIPVDSLIRAKDGESLDRPLLWEFSGSDFKDLYSPDLSGDFAIFWHAHDSVLRVDHEGIASGVVKLEAVPHPKLNNGAQVTLELVPISK